MPTAPFAVQILICVGSMLIMSIGAYHLIEQPMIRLGSRIAQLAERQIEQKELARYRIPEAEIL